MSSILAQLKNGTNAISISSNWQPYGDNRENVITFRKRMRPINKWDQSDLQFLIDNKLGETIEREYKQTISIGSPKEKKELCKQVSAFANSQGGIIVFGLEETEQKDAGSIPTSCLPIRDASLKERAQQVILDGIQPRLEFRFYSFADNDGQGEFVVIEIPKSFRGLHMVTSDKDNRYYVRRDYQAVPMTPFEIEETYRTFALMEISIEERLSKVGHRFPNVIGPDTWAAWLSVVAVPLFPMRELFVPICFMNNVALTELSIGMRTKRGLAGSDAFYPSVEGLVSKRSNNEGVTLYEHTIFRDGAVRLSHCVGRPRTSRLVGALDIIEDLHNVFSFLVGLFERAGYSSRIGVSCDVTFNQQYRLGVPDSVPGPELHASEEVGLHVDFRHSFGLSPRDWIDNAPAVLEPLLHHLWQSFGFLRCYCYQDVGEYEKHLVVERLHWIE